MMSRQIPMVLTVEQREGAYPDHRGNVYPGGYPVVTSVRDMNWLERIVYTVTKRFKPARTPRSAAWEHVQHGRSMALELSKSEHTRLLGASGEVFTLSCKVMPSGELESPEDRSAVV